MIAKLCECGTTGLTDATCSPTNPCLKDAFFSVVSLESCLALWLYFEHLRSVFVTCFCHD